MNKPKDTNVQAEFSIPKGHLKKIRMSKGFTQENIADKLKFSLPNYQKKERGEVSITAEEHQQIASILGVSTDYLFGKTENPNVVEHDIEVVDYVNTQLIQLSPLLNEVAANFKKYNEDKKAYVMVSRDKISKYFDNEYFSEEEAIILILESLDFYTKSTANK